MDGTAPYRRFVRSSARAAEPGSWLFPIPTTTLPETVFGNRLRRGLMGDMGQNGDWLKTDRLRAMAAADKEAEELQRATAMTKPFRLMDLPAELRKRIYHYTLEPRRDYTVQGGVWYIYTDMLPNKHFYPTISKASKLVAHEAIAVFYDRHAVVALIGLNNKAQYLAWLAKMPAYDISCIRHLHIEDYQLFRESPEESKAHPKYCYSRLEVDVLDVLMPVRYLRDPCCKFCPHNEAAVARVAAVVRSTGQQLPSVLLTKAKILQMFYAAAWP